MSEWRRRRCKSCGAVVIWSKTAAGEPIATVVRPEDDPEGQRLFEVEKRERFRAHWSSCPHAGLWRGRLR